MSSVLGRARVAPPPPRAFVICYCPHHPSRPPGRSHASPAPARGTVKPDRSKWISVEERRCRLSVKLRPRQEEGDPSPESTSFSAGVGSWGGRTSLLWQNEFNGGKNYWIAGELQENCRRIAGRQAWGQHKGLWMEKYQCAWLLAAIFRKACSFPGISYLRAGWL